MGVKKRRINVAQNLEAILGDLDLFRYVRVNITLSCGRAVAVSTNA